MNHIANRKRRETLDRIYVEHLWRRASRDAEWFIRNCVQIPSQRAGAEDGREPFDLFDYQAEDLEKFVDERFLIMLKCRQIGASTLIAAYVLWLALFRPGAVVLWISNSQDNADKAIGMLSVMWAYLPEWLKGRAPEMVSDQAGKKEWRHRGGMKSRIRSLAGTSTAGASETATLVVLDEFALIDPKTQEDLFRSTEPTTDAGGKLFILSTARGGHNRFARMYRNAERGDSKFQPIFHPWYVSRFVNPLADRYASCPDGPCDACVDPTVYNAKAAEFTENPWLLQAEYPSVPEDAFRESGNPRFPSLPPLEACETDWLRGELETVDGVDVFVEDDDGPLRIRRDIVDAGPERWRDYVLFADPSRGTGGDYFAAHVLTYDDDDEPDRVAWWHSNVIEPTEVARRLDRLGRWFEGARGPALFAIETTGGWGDLPLNELQVHLAYPRIYFEQRTGHRRRTAEAKYGFSMNAQRRPKVIDRLAGYVADSDDQPCRLSGIDPLLRYELGTFVKTETGRYQADTGCHDDLVMSLAGALWVLLERVPATERPKGEAPDVDPVPTADLSGMFERIEKVRKAEREKIRRETRMTRRASRRRAPAGRR